MGVADVKRVSLSGRDRSHHVLVGGSRRRSRGGGRGPAGAAGHVLPETGLPQAVHVPAALPHHLLAVAHPAGHEKAER